jgi:hypothetical protein
MDLIGFIPVSLCCVLERRNRSHGELAKPQDQTVFCLIQRHTRRLTMRCAPLRLMDVIHLAAKGDGGVSGFGRRRWDDRSRGCRPIGTARDRCERRVRTVGLEDHLPREEKAV